MNNNIDYTFLEYKNSSIEKGEKLKIVYFSDGKKSFILETNFMERFEKYIFLKKNKSFKCYNDSIIFDFDFEKINKDSLENVSVFSDSVFLKYYNNSGDSIFQIFADDVIHYSDQNIIELKNNVILKNNQNDVLKTNNLFWNTLKEKILSLDSVSIETKDKVIQGCGFYSDDNFENYKIYNISGTIQIDSE